MSENTKWIIAFFNVLLIAGQVVVFLTDLWWKWILTHEILLRFGIISFFVNYLLLKQIWFPHHIQRIVAFILINFGVYLSIANIWGAQPLYFVSIGSIRSIVNNLLMTQTKWILKSSFLQEYDYLYRIWANALITFLNVYFMFLLPVSLQMRFFIALMYFGLQMFLILYNLWNFSSYQKAYIGKYSKLTLNLNDEC